MPKADIGQKIGCGAHLSGLIRTKTNQFNLQQAYTLDELSNTAPEELTKLLLPVDILVRNLGKINLSDSQYAKIKNGHHVPLEHTYVVSGNLLFNQSTLYYNNIFLGVATIEEQIIKPLRLCNTLNL